VPSYNNVFAHQVTDMEHQQMLDRTFMRQAIDQALNAQMLGEVPVGAVLVHEGKILSTGYNQPIGNNDPTAHAEIQAIRAAAELLGNYRLPECTLYVTLEPCVMCSGAIMHARMKRVVFGASDAKTGACGSVLNLFDESKLNHHTQVEGGLLAETSVGLLKAFFAERRLQKQKAAEDNSAAIEVKFED
jgi:tRNA(adenine34) deaminase